MAARWIAALLLAVLALGGVFYWKQERPMANDEIAGTLVAGMGDTLAEVAARSTYPLNLAILTDEDLSAADRPVRFSYAGEGAIDLPATRTVAINSVATVVTGIETAPQLEYLGRDAVLLLADEMEQRLAVAGWRRDAAAAGVVGRGELALRLGDPAAPAVTAWHIGVYRFGETTLTLRLRRLHLVGGDFPEGAYLLNFVWRNDRLREQAEAVADRLRREDHVSVVDPRPVDATAYGTRVRALMPRR